MVRPARDLGAKTMLGRVPSIWPRWISRLHLHAVPAGPVLMIDGMSVQVAMMDLSRGLH